MARRTVGKISTAIAFSAAKTYMAKGKEDSKHE